MLVMVMGGELAAAKSRVAQVEEGGPMVARVAFSKPCQPCHRLMHLSGFQTHFFLKQFL